MASITVRDLEEGVKARLRLRAARHKRSMEAEARNILRTALAEGTRSSGNLGDALRRRFAAFGGVELPIPPRLPMRDPPRFDE